MGGKSELAQAVYRDGKFLFFTGLFESILTLFDVSIGILYYVLVFCENPDKR